MGLVDSAGWLTFGAWEDDTVRPFAVKYVITSPLSLARVLWWYGEDDL
jgi:hypothetical protein